jgi:hypothetical protein
LDADSPYGACDPAIVLVDVDEFVGGERDVVRRDRPGALFPLEDDCSFGDRLAGDGEPLIKPGESGGLMVGEEQKAAACGAATVLRL